MEYLNKINSPEDLKKVPIEKLPIVAEEVREVLLQKMSAVGGHFGPNFGMVEATIALHYVFSSPKDKFVFDVSHQSYTHKILTGRREAFTNPEMYNKVTGYTEPKESEHDLFTIGHTSTSVSLALGLAEARDLKGDKENVIAIIGDGSLSGGEAYEGLDLGGTLKTNFIVVVNDNQMSIAEDHGGLYGHLKELRDSKGSSANNIFKALGYDYVYVADGNDVVKLVDTFKNVKDIDHPIVVHICTVKGKGYEIAEENKELWHWRPSFDPKTGRNLHPLTGENYDDLVADYLESKMKSDPKVACVVAAVPATIGFDKPRRDRAGKQFIDVGIAEENGIAMSAGMAKNGCKPVFATFATFFQRTYDQISQEICINDLPVTMLVRNASVWGPKDVTHLGLYDIPMMSNIPNLVYLAPTNCEEYFAMLDWAIDQQSHPVAIRIPRNGVHHTNEAVQKDYSDINKSLVTNNGNKIAVLALGDFYQMGEELVQAIKDEININATLINPRFITGLDINLLESLKKEHNLVITLEDGILDGGYGQKVASFYGSSNMKVQNYGLKKEFLDQYNPADVLEKNGITIPNIIQRIHEVL